jgi:hypothetical protein
MKINKLSELLQQYDPDTEIKAAADWKDCSGLKRFLVGEHIVVGGCQFWTAFMNVEAVCRNLQEEIDQLRAEVKALREK